MSVLLVSSRRVLTYFLGLRLSGLIGAGLLFALSMAPSLIPRAAAIKGMLSGIGIIIILGGLLSTASVVLKPQHCTGLKDFLVLPEILKKEEV